MFMTHDYHVLDARLHVEIVGDVTSSIRGRGQINKITNDNTLFDHLNALIAVYKGDVSVVQNYELQFRPGFHVDPDFTTASTIFVCCCQLRTEQRISSHKILE